VIRQKVCKISAVENLCSPEKWTKVHHQNGLNDPPPLDCREEVGEQQNARTVIGYNMVYAVDYASVTSHNQLSTML